LRYEEISSSNDSEVIGHDGSWPGAGAVAEIIETGAILPTPNRRFT